MRRGCGGLWDCGVVCEDQEEPGWGLYWPLGRASVSSGNPGVQTGASWGHGALLPWGPRSVVYTSAVSVCPQVSNINQPLEITAISSPETSLKSSPVPYQDHDQPPVLKKERPLSQTNGAHYSPLTSDEEPGSEDEPSSARRVQGPGGGQGLAAGAGGACSLCACVGGEDWQALRGGCPGREGGICLVRGLPAGPGPCSGQGWPPGPFAGGGTRAGPPVRRGRPGRS